METKQYYHAVLFPFMAKGHIIPLLHFAHLLLRRRSIHVTFVTTPATRSFVADHLGGHPSSDVVAIPFPQGIVPPGVESSDKLPSMSLFPRFVMSTKLMLPDFERALGTLHGTRPVDFLVSDGFLGWTLESANKFGIPRLVFYGMSCYASCICKTVGDGNLLAGADLADDDPVTLPEFPWIQVTRNDFEPPFSDPEPKGPYFDFHVSCFVSSANSFGLIVNGCYELEPFFVDHWNRHALPKAWCVGPFCLAEPDNINRSMPGWWIEWLDRKLEQGVPILYVAFGSQAEISSNQVKEIGRGLEDSGVSFLWVIKNRDSELEEDRFEDQVKDRGIVVREWVDQREILTHPSVQGFLSHCGLNSTMEAISVGVPILAWPMMAEQPLNARMVVEEIKVGLRVETFDGSVRGFVTRDGLAKMVKELMEGERGKKVRKRAKEYGEMAEKAMEEGTGSSWRNLNSLMGEICKRKEA
ncbi:unnamed protein product [Linum tenue]|uniref:Glycosyltransferase n=1 Tax=Linum tenue TaxID=586396 RepID=A0AAV0N9W0_9ROSI|nr:unnamed protein product [Linum tenue]